MIHYACIMEKKLNIGIWLRVSTDEQAQGGSPEHHLKRAQAYAEAKDWNVVEIYDLSGVSGKSVMQHAECQRMMEDVRTGKIDALIFSKLARLARNTRELLDFADFFQENKASLVSLSESIDTSTPAGKLFYTMISAVAAFERDEISDRVKASIPIRAQMGKQLGGQATFGYQWQDQKLIPHPDEAPIRALLYELFKEHGLKRKVARILNERGYRTRKGAKFSDTTVDRLLRDPTAKGVRLSNYTESPGDGKPAVLKDKDDWVYVNCPAIVSVELWDECNRMLTDQAKSRKKRGRPAIHLFGGKAVCSCEQKMHFKKGTGKYHCSQCRNKIREDDLEAILVEQLKNFLLSEEEIAEYMRHAKESAVTKRKELNVALSEQERLKAQTDKLLNLHLSDDLEKEVFLRQYKPLEKQLFQIEENIPALQAACDVEEISIASSDQIFNEARSVYAQWETLQKEEKKHIIDLMLEDITVDQDEISINLNHLPHPPSLHKHGDNATQPQGFMAAISWILEG